MECAEVGKKAGKWTHCCHSTGHYLYAYIPKSRVWFSGAGDT